MENGIEELNEIEEVPEIKTKFTFDITTKFKFANGSAQDDAKYIELHAPTSRHARECCELKQAFFRSMQEQQDSSETKLNVQDKDPTDIKGPDVMQLIAISRNVNLADTLDIARLLFAGTGIAMINGEIKLNKETINRMSVDDFENMLGEYLVNFTLAFSLGQAKKNISKDSQT
jgi:hypothetical protein